MIEINNLTSRDIDKDSLKKVANLVLKEEGKRGDLSLALVGENRIRKINKMYRGKNRVTDVLSFPEKEVRIEKFKIGPTEKHKGLGEIIMCPKRVKKNAKRLEVNFEKEMTRVLIHGILHLLGYNHKKEEEEKEMKEKENYYLKKVSKK